MILSKQIYDVSMAADTTVMEQRVIPGPPFGVKFVLLHLARALTPRLGNDMCLIEMSVCSCWSAALTGSPGRALQST